MDKMFSKCVHGVTAIRCMYCYSFQETRKEEKNTMTEEEQAKLKAFGKKYVDEFVHNILDVQPMPAADILLEQVFRKSTRWEILKSKISRIPCKIGFHNNKRFHSDAVGFEIRCSRCWKKVV